jgi:hypothetical protein
MNGDETQNGELTNEFKAHVAMKHTELRERTAPIWYENRNVSKERVKALGN